MKLWDVTTGKELATLKGHTGKVFSVAFAADGKTLATGSVDQTVRLWFAATDAEVAAQRAVISPLAKTTLIRPCTVQQAREPP